jgi:hypothetical protein
MRTALKGPFMHGAAHLNEPYRFGVASASATRASRPGLVEPAFQAEYDTGRCL